MGFFSISLPSIHFLFRSFILGVGVVVVVVVVVHPRLLLPVFLLLLLLHLTSSLLFPPPPPLLLLLFFFFFSLPCLFFLLLHLTSSFFSSSFQDAGALFSSGVQDGGQFMVIFAAAGEYAYHCGEHPDGGAWGVVTVQPCVDSACDSFPGGSSEWTLDSWRLRGIIIAAGGVLIILLVAAAVCLCRRRRRASKVRRPQFHYVGVGQTTKQVNPPVSPMSPMPRGNLSSYTKSMRASSQEQLASCQVTRPK